MIYVHLYPFIKIKSPEFESLKNHDYFDIETAYGYGGPISNKFDLVEIHNRPLILFRLINRINSRFIFYFHNDPLSMKGSKTIKERLFILKSVEKIVFVSEWTRNRFFTDLDKKLITKTEIIYPSVNKQKIKSKKKIITYVGKLNYSKGYDLFEKAITKILDEYPKWKSFSVGDEERRNIYIKH